MSYPRTLGELSAYDGGDSFDSFVDQTPSGLDTPLQISFGPGGDTLNGGLTVSPNGDLIINVTGFYAVKVRLKVGRTGASGVSRIFNWVEESLDGGSTWNRRGNSISVSLNSSIDSDLFFDFSPLRFPAGYRLRAMIARSSTGDNSGGLVTVPASAALKTAGASDTPSASVTLYGAV